MDPFCIFNATIARYIKIYSYLCTRYNTLMRIIMVSVAIKNRTRDEIIAAFRESIRKKQEWIKQSDEEFKRIREERRQLAL